MGLPLTVAAVSFGSEPESGPPDGPQPANPAANVNTAAEKRISLVDLRTLDVAPLAFSVPLLT